MKKQNRPYSLINVFDNLRGAFPKPAIQLCLDRLSSETGILFEKTYGAQKFYFCKQSIFGDCSAEAVKQLETEVAEIRKSQLCVSTQIAEINSTCPVPDSILISKNKQALKEFENLKNQIDQMKRQTEGKSQLISELEHFSKKFAAAKDEADKRKRIFMRMLDHLAEGLNMTRSDLAEELGCELSL